MALQGLQQQREERGPGATGSIDTVLGGELPPRGWAVGLGSRPQVLIPQLGLGKSRRPASCALLPLQNSGVMGSSAARTPTKGRDIPQGACASFAMLGGRFPCCMCKVGADMVLTKSYECFENALSSFLSRS